MFDLQKHSQNEAVITDSNERFTYEQLDIHCDALYDAIGERCLVFCLCRNEIGSLVGYISFLNHEVVPLMLRADISEESLGRFLELYKPAFIYLPDSETHRFTSMSLAYSHLGYSLLKTEYNNVYPLNHNLALLLTTSGSTGSPKLVRQSYKNIQANTKSIVEYLKLTPEETAITTLPMYYTYGISILNTHLWIGASIVLTDSTLIQKEFWRLAKDHKVTSLAGVPYTYEILDKLRFRRMDLPELKTMTQAGGKLAPELHLKYAQWAFEQNKRFIVMYGQTEATARMSYLPPEKSVEKNGGIGIAVPGGTFGLVDESGKIITEPGVVGELVYQGDNVALGYAESGDQLLIGDECRGTLHTGDMAQFDEDGFYFIVGRKKRFLKIFGNRVNLDEAERLLMSKFVGLDCACCGLDDKMYIFITDEGRKRAVAECVASVTQIHPTAFNVRVIEDIPKNEVGKKQYKELERYY